MTTRFRTNHERKKIENIDFFEFSINFQVIFPTRRSNFQLVFPIVIVAAHPEEVNVEKYPKYLSDHGKIKIKKSRISKQIAFSEKSFGRDVILKNSRNFSIYKYLLRIIKSKI